MLGTIWAVSCTVSWDDAKHGPPGILGRIRESVANERVDVPDVPEIKGPLTGIKWC